MDNIAEIGIDSLGRLYIKPAREKFTLIYRTATEVHWDNEGKFLYSPTPREWSYLDWYKHIAWVLFAHCDCQLQLTADTKWVNIPPDLQRQIQHSQEAGAQQ